MAGATMVTNMAPLSTDELLTREQRLAALRLCWVRVVVAGAFFPIVLVDLLIGQSGADLRPSVWGALVYLLIAVALLLLTRSASRFAMWASLGVAVVDLPVVTAIEFLQMPRLSSAWHALPTTTALGSAFVALSFLSLSTPAVVAATLGASVCIAWLMFRVPDLPIGPIVVSASLPIAIGVIGVILVRRLRAWVFETREKDVAAALALSERVQQLENKELELQALNSELRRQVAERSRALVSSLSSATSSAPSLLPAENDLFDGRYKVIRPVGRGGMGAVFEVHRLSDLKPFALKLMTGPVDAAMATRFLREAELAARIHHSNLVTVVDVGTSTSGTLFLVMELVEGHSLERLVTRWKDRHWALSVLTQVARGVEALHREHVVHRDLKPANILVKDRAGRPEVKVSDFGIARQLAATDPFADTASPKEGDFTQTGATIGTPRYLPPELVGNAKAVSVQADTFSFGVMACEVLCDRYPFVVPPALEVLARREPSAADTSFLGTSGLPARLVEVLIRCLALRAPLRPQASELLTALEEALAEVSLSASSTVRSE